MPRYLALLLLLCLTLNAHADSYISRLLNKPVPGGVAVVDLGSAVKAPKASYQGKPVLVVKEQDNWLAIVGIPLTVQPGTQQISSGGGTQPFVVGYKKYPEQHITLKNKRQVKQAVEIIRSGGVVVYPTDSSYAIGCQIGDKNAVERVRRLRQLDDKHNFALICSDLSQLGLFAKIDTGTFRLLKAHLPGPYTFILNATREVPRLLLHPKKRTIGLRVPSHPIALALLAELGEPLMSVTLIMPGETDPLTDPYEMRQILEHQVDLIIDGGFGGMSASTVINLADGEPQVVRVGCGDPTPFMVEA